MKTAYLLINDYIYINIYNFTSGSLQLKVYNLIYKNYINNNAFQNLRSLKTYRTFQFSKQEKYALYCNNV